MKKIVLFISLSLLILVGCERKRSEHNYERTIWVNPDVECCGVKDPLNNLEWLREMSKFDEYKTISQTCSKYLFLYKNGTTQENFIVIFSENEQVTKVLRVNCNGEKSCDHIIAQKMSVDLNLESCYACLEFNDTHTMVDTIAYYIVR